MNKSIKKKDQAKELLKSNQDIFKCPVCNGKMFVNDGYSLTCESNHSFDIAKKGYLNLLRSRSPLTYSKELFESRYIICESGFYDPLIEKLVGIIIDNSHGNILDAGCGEGSHIISIYKKISDNLTNYVGIDISKDSINIASRNNAKIIWCVADLAKLPFKNASFDIILNILSPGNYSEFSRVINNTGLIIKVAPASNYLIELRERLYEGDASKYSNHQVIDNMSKKLNIKDIQNLSYSFKLDRGLLKHLINMTPLTWGTSNERLNDLYRDNLSSITVDLSIVSATKRD